MPSLFTDYLTFVFSLANTLKLWPQSQSWPKLFKARESAPASYFTEPEPPNAEPKLWLLSQAEPAIHYSAWLQPLYNERVYNYQSSCKTLSKKVAKKPLKWLTGNTPMVVLLAKSVMLCYHLVFV